MNYNDYWQVIADKTGYDFSGYSQESLNRKLEKFISSESIGSAEELRFKLFSDKIIKDKILGRLLTNYTELFRDPGFFLTLKVSVLPYLATYPRINIWHAGCATGEEVYSLAILLDELAVYIVRMAPNTAPTPISPAMPKPID
jgi:chemotaxis protein methyltransferase CheR